MTLQAVALQLLTGLSRAAVLFIVASGLSLVFGALRIVNLAHGSFYMLGAFIATTVVAMVAGPAGFALALVVAAVAVAGVSTLVETTVLRRLYGQEHLLQLLATFAVLLIISDAVRFLWGEQARTVRQPEFLRGPIRLTMGETVLVFPRYGLFLIAVAVVLAVGLALLINRTGLGRDIRAAVSDPEMLGMVGVNVPRLFTSVFALGSALAALGGVLAAPQSTVLLGIDVDIIIESFAVVIIGGLGSLVGTAVGALLVGLTFAFGIVLAPNLALAIVFLVMVAVLVWRPSGLFGLPER